MCDHSLGGNSPCISPGAVAQDQLFSVHYAVIDHHYRE